MSSSKRILVLLSNMVLAVPVDGYFSRLVINGLALAVASHLFAFSQLIGIGLIGIGVWAYLYKYPDGGIPRFRSIVDLFFDAAILIGLIGCVIFILGFSGCLGALRENMCLLRFVSDRIGQVSCQFRYKVEIFLQFSISLFILFLLEVAAGILGFVFSQQMREAIEQELTDQGIVLYREEPDRQNAMDFLQQHFKCCGFRSYKDWSLNAYFNCSDSNESVERCGVPFSCCRNPADMATGLVNVMCGFEQQNKPFSEAIQKIYTDGCVEEVLAAARENLYVVGGVALAIAFVQLLGIYLSRTLIFQIQEQRSLWDRNSARQ